MPSRFLQSKCFPVLISTWLALGCGQDEEVPPPPRCPTASQADIADVHAAYEIWKEDLVTSEGAGGFRRVRRPDTPDGVPNSTVSEGIAYGMILAAYLDDQALFDDLWQYSQLWLDHRGLMYWYIDPEGTTVCPERTDGCGAATDSDEDIAWALIVAHYRWGQSPVLDTPYLDLAKQQIELVFEHEVDPQGNVLRPGDSFGGFGKTNPSYFAPAYYRVFGEITGNVDGWNAVIDSSYQVIENSLDEKYGNADNGLVPAWCEFRGAPAPPVKHFQYDSIRTPFRIGQDYCWNGEPRAKASLDKVNAFFGAIGPDQIVDGYELDGTPRPDEHSAEPMKSAVFTGCTGVGAMADGARQAFVDRSYERLLGHDLNTRSRYYQRSWTVLSLLMMSGRFVDPTRFPLDD